MNTTNRLTSRTVARGAAIAGAAVLGATLLAGCTGPAASPSASPTVLTNGLPAGVKQATSVPTNVANTPALRKDVTITTCEKADGGWKASGVAKNASGSDRIYTITVFFTTDHGTVIGTGETKAKVGKGASADWTVAAKLTPAPATRCVLRGVGE